MGVGATSLSFTHLKGEADTGMGCKLGFVLSMEMAPVAFTVRRTLLVRGSVLTAGPY